MIENQRALDTAAARILDALHGALTIPTNLTHQQLTLLEVREYFVAGAAVAHILANAADEPWYPTATRARLAQMLQLQRHLKQQQDLEDTEDEPCPTT